MNYSCIKDGPGKLGPHERNGKSACVKWRVVIQWNELVIDNGTCLKNIDDCMTSLHSKAELPIG